MSKSEDKNSPLENSDISIKRIEHLESVVRWHMFVLDMLASLGDIHGNATENRDPEYIFSLSRQYIQRIHEFDAVAFMLINDEDSDFKMANCFPVEQNSNMQEVIEELVESGEFAWALNQNRCVDIQPASIKNNVVLHVLTSKTRTRGMFVGRMKTKETCLSSANANVLSILLQHTAYALESSALYQMISNQNRSLESTIEQRTRELQHQYGHDSLTALPNRLLFHDRLKQAMVRAERNGDYVAIIMLDLDMFKRINDSLGPIAGDQLLITVASRLCDCLRNSDTISRLAGDETNVTISRLGGDEFGILLSDLHQTDPVTRVLQRIMDALSVDAHIDGHEISMTCSVGVSIYPDDNADVDTLLKFADTAMYHAKQQGRNNYQFYSQQMTTSSFRQLLMENQLRNAIQRDEFVLYYQPKINIAENEVCGVEALIRWEHPDMGLVPPNDFIPIAEYTGLIIQIGDWVLKKACLDAKQWIDKGYSEITVAVNLSVHQFRENILDRVKEALEASGLEARHLELEITESTLMDDVDHAVSIMKSLHELGVHISVDDFGTGYSSLSYLKRLPLDSLKIDRSFVKDTPTDDDDSAIVASIISLAHNLGLNVIAEGVENKEQLDFLRSLECNEYQGYFYSPPVPFDKFLEIIS